MIKDCIPVTAIAKSTAKDEICDEVDEKTSTSASMQMYAQKHGCDLN